MIAHTLGNPFDLGAVTDALPPSTTCWLIEDCCDALGATYDGQPVGTFGDAGDAVASTPPTTSPWARAARS